MLEKKIEGTIKNDQSTETDYIGYIGHNTRTNKAKKKTTTIMKQTQKCK